ncbi:MAG: hypothetical protein ACREP8_14855, partial [Candidatus Binatia bacterium]
FCMAIGVLERKAGIAQFKDRKVRDPKVIDLMKRVTLSVDQELEALGYDRVRSRIRIKLKNGDTLEGRADVARGHPLKPMSWAEIGEKFRDCAGLALTRKSMEQAMELVASLDRMKSILTLVRAVAGGKGNSAKRKAKKMMKKSVRKRPRSKRWSGIQKR